MSARLTHPSITPAGRPVRFWYDGQPEGLEGETIAAALAAGGIKAMRHTRGGERRGLFCGMGACFDCLVTVDGQASQRACLTKVADGQQVRSTQPAGTPDDPLQPLTPQAGAEPDRRRVDVLVIGAGPAGLSAALAARRAGADVLVLDERPQSGGQFYKPLAPSHAAPSPADRQFAQGLALESEVRAAGVAIAQGAQVWAAFSAHEVAALIDGRACVIGCRQLVIAPGAYERPVPFPGWTLPGVMTTGAGQTLARAYRVAPGRRVVIANPPQRPDNSAPMSRDSVKAEARAHNRNNANNPVPKGEVTTTVNHQPNAMPQPTGEMSRAEVSQTGRKVTPRFGEKGERPDVVTNPTDKTGTPK